MTRGAWLLGWDLAVKPCPRRTDGHQRASLHAKQDLRESWKINAVPWGQAQHHRAEQKKMKGKQHQSRKAKRSHGRRCRGHAVAGAGEDSERAMTEEGAEHRQKESEHPRTDYESNHESKTCFLGKSSGRREASCHTHSEQR